jgi:uncharacterized Zn-finger protein
MNTLENTDKNQAIAVTATDLPLHCPVPGAPLWARHPRVFLDVAITGEASLLRCEICVAWRCAEGTLAQAVLQSQCKGPLTAARLLCS